MYVIEFESVVDSQQQLVSQLSENQQVQKVCCIYHFQSTDTEFRNLTVSDLMLVFINELDRFFCRRTLLKPRTT